MCGFAGEFLFAAASAHADVVLATRLAEALRHRGPDEAATFVSQDRRCAIAFHRLAVIDPPGSHQPMTLPDGALTVAFNGEIYNFRSLRADLEADGCRFATAGDTEVLLHLYRRRGADLVDDLDGMFAFALHDAEAGQLLLARDRLGQKPLWYALLGDRIVFASEARALLRHPQIDRSLDRASLAFYATLGYVPAPASAWRGIRKLPPASCLLVSTGPAEPRRFWRPELVEPPPTPADAVRQVRTTLAASVAARMVSDVPLGALLSGGLDSAIVAALMSEAAGTAGGIRTFTAGFPDAAYDERALARLTARRLGSDHTELVLDAAPADALDDLVARYAEPFADSSALPTWLICQAARQHVTVALTGDGGDELFGGYDRYRALHLASTMRPATYLAVRLAAALAAPWAPLSERSRLRRLVRFADSLPYPPAQQYFRYRRLFGPRDLTRLFTEEFARQICLDEPARWFLDLYEQADLDDEVQHAQRHDLLTYLPDDLLVKADIASMACSLELRSPMLAAPLVGLGLSLPVGMKISGGRGKAILREAFADVLPPEVLRGPKRGFGVPLARWLREDLAGTLQETLLDESFLGREIIRREAIAGLLNDHFSRRDDHSHRLWALLILARWLAAQG